MLRVAQCLKSGLPGKLEGHKYKAKEINFQGTDSGIHHLQVVGEDAKPEPREKDDADPCQHGVRRANESIEADSRFYPEVLFGTVIKADNRLGSVDDTIDGQYEYFSDRIQYSHDSHVYITAVALQGGIADNLHQTVSSLHDEVGGTKLTNFFGDRPA